MRAYRAILILSSPIILAAAAVLLISGKEVGLWERNDETGLTSQGSVLPGPHEFWPADTTYLSAVAEQPELLEVAYYWFGTYNEDNDTTERIADTLFIPENAVLPEPAEYLRERIDMGDIPGRLTSDLGYRFIVVEPYQTDWRKQLAFPGGRLENDTDIEIHKLIIKKYGP
jgi:hypothetical protein